MDNNPVLVGRVGNNTAKRYVQIILIAKKEHSVICDDQMALVFVGVRSRDRVRSGCTCPASPAFVCVSYSR